MDTGARDLSWGDARARALLQDIARDAAARAGFRLCAIEVVRAQGLLEIVAVAGDPQAAEKMLGTGSRLEDMLVTIAEGTDFGHFTFVAEEGLSPAVHDLLREVACIPDIPATGRPEDWSPMDMLVARIRDERGDLRALLYLDEPFGLKRLSADRLRALSETLAMNLLSVLTVIEREEFAHHMRVIGATRRLARSSPARHDVAHLLREARLTLVDVLAVDALEIHLFDVDEPDHDALGLGLSPALRRSLDAAAEEAWAEQRVVIIEPGHVWGDAGLHASHADWFTEALAGAGFGAVVVAPVGVDDKVLGMLLVARVPGSRRWTDGEGVAALELGHDLGRAIANANATERERHLLEELRQLEESRFAFLKVLIHEINNPMTVISANAEFLLSTDELDTDDLQRAASAVVRGAERLGSLLEGLMLLSRVSDPEPQPMESLDLAVLVGESMASMTAVAERADVTLEFASGRDGFTIGGDRREVAGAVANLVDNAVKYSNAGGHVRMELDRGDDVVAFICRDEGLGISEADQRHLFRPLFRSTNEEAIRRPGTGLGLSIVRDIMVRHGGRVELESSLGVGTTARLVFPVPARTDGSGEDLLDPRGHELGGRPLS